jgi:membrane fusion protein, macrolide-specific efflux system
MRSRRMAVVIVIVLVVLGGLFLSSRGGASPTNATTYLSESVRRTDVVREAVADGTVRAVTTYGLAFGTEPALIPAGSAGTGGSGAGSGAGPWIVTSVAVTVGQTVKAGDVLAQADTADAKRQLSIAEATLQAAEAQFEDANDGPSDAATENARAAVRRARDEVIAAKRTIALATLRAPEAGTVVASDLVKGIAAPSGYAIELASARLEVVAEFAESDIAALALDQTASVTVGAADAELTGRVTRIVPAASTAGTRGVVTFQAAVELAAGPGILPGMSAEVAVITATADGVLAVPAAAVGGVKGAYTVRILDTAGAPQVRAVQVGLATPTLVEITAGVTEGEKVVVGTTADRAQSTIGNGQGGGGGGFGQPSSTPTATP